MQSSSRSNQTFLLQANKALKQIPFNGKKLKPAKIRKDYWRRMAVIQFPEGKGDIGRSVYHIMREFRMAHELGWADDMFVEEKTGRTLTRLERGAKLNDQKANTIADMAAVLGGAGKGNKMWVPGPTEVDTAGATRPDGESRAVATQGVEVDFSGETKVDEENGTTLGLLGTTVIWENELDKNFATAWPSNVMHGSFSTSRNVPVDVVET
jgi:hypothetical protein